ncbi:MAG: hypothetical protein COU27_02190 [Candidatus Levybacteria bacterium CG10_big_fil_rev_8_21_14_0_10_36_7]|nr:MAG: hypothetical protein COU27_02190 [Candidatus Levybacteria bacterium CG10_big_fil_rev_8_21_14_0_10_36_7]
MQQKKKILYIITKSVWGGAQKYVYDLAVNLPKDKFDVIVAGGQAEGPKKGIMELELGRNKVVFYKIKSFQRDVNILKEFIAGFEILFILFKTKPNIVHVSSSKAGGVAGVASLLYKLLTFRKLKTIFTIHGWAFLESRPKWQIVLIKLFSWITCLFYDKIITVSEYGRQIGIENKIVSLRKAIPIHNGINIGNLNYIDKEESRAELVERFQYFKNPSLQAGAKPKLESKTEIWIGTTGELTKNKGHQYFIDAVKKLKDKGIEFKTIIIGAGEEKEERLKQIKNNKLENDVFLAGFIFNASKYLKALDIFVFPSIKEGFPYTILEAGLAELPIISTITGGIPEQIENDKDGILVESANSEKLAEAIERLINNKNLREKYAKKFNQKVLEKFSLDKQIEETIKIYS